MRGPVTYTSTSSLTWPGTMLTLSMYLHTNALRVGSENLLPFGNSMKRRTRDPALSTTYLVPTGRRFGRRELTALTPKKSRYAPPSDTLCPDFDRTGVIHTLLAYCGHMFAVITISVRLLWLMVRIRHNRCAQNAGTSAKRNQLALNLNSCFGRYQARRPLKRLAVLAYFAR